MRMRTAALIVAVLVLGGLALFAATSGDESGLGDVPQAPGPGAESEAGESEGGTLSPVGDWLFAQRSGPRAVRAVLAYEAALEQAARLHETTRTSAPELAAATWTHLGPKELGGRVSDVAVDGSQPDTVYAAAGSGGVWKSTDGGLRWTSSWPLDRTQSTGALAAAPDGVLYAGTGEPTPAGGYVVSVGEGVYRSDDGGASWEPSGLEDSGSIGRIAVDPEDPDTIFAAAAGHLLFPGDRGLYRSRDGGGSWDLVLEGENASTGAIDVAVGPDGLVLAAMWDRDVLEKRLTGAGSGVHVSKDGGDTWEEARLPGLEEEAGRIGVALSPSDPARGYAVVANDSGGEAVGLWRSDDAGRTWNRTAASLRSLDQGTYGWWFGRLYVDPRSSDRLFVAGIRLLESTDGGDSFSPQVGAAAPGLPVAESALASNQHAMAWDPDRPGRVYLGNDGGMYRSNGDAHQGTWVPARAQGWTQHYSVAGSSWTASVARPSSSPAGAVGDSPAQLTVVVPAPSAPEVLYGATARGTLFRSEDGGSSWARLDHGSSGNESKTSVIAVDREDPDSVFVAFTDPSGASRVIETSDGGSTWSEIGQGLPEAPVNDAEVMPDGAIAVATDVGVFVNGEPSWLALGSGLPRVPVLEISLHPESRVMTAATFGRGIQRIVLP